MYIHLSNRQRKLVRWAKWGALALLLYGALAVAFGGSDAPQAVVIERVTDTGYAYEVIQKAQNTTISLPILGGFGLVLMVIALRVVRRDEDDVPTALSLEAPAAQKPHDRKAA